MNVLQVHATRVGTSPVYGAGAVVIVEVEKLRPKLACLSVKSEQILSKVAVKPDRYTVSCIAWTKRPVGRPKKTPFAGSACTTNCSSHDENSLCVLATHRLATHTSIIPRPVDKLYLDVTSIYLAPWLFSSNFAIHPPIILARMLEII